MSEHIEITRDIVVAMIEHGIFDGQNDGVANRDKLIIERICKAFEEVYKTVENPKGSQAGFRQSLYGTVE